MKDDHPFHTISADADLSGIDRSRSSITIIVDHFGDSRLVSLVNGKPSGGIPVSDLLLMARKLLEEVGRQLRVPIGSVAAAMMEIKRQEVRGPE